ncbi:ABC transporter ATP-binding protein [Planctobacterium marinum]|uniref:Methionine ABC transporter ATP-binding protein n=1 Tax=Planctobacterium marinum TaxID=1631968 RepID=A0AA48KWJ0_9ALTE|nr:methionine ABC transporter ATP-binding protein [Planctobacterium marinum]
MNEAAKEQQIRIENLSFQYDKSSDHNLIEIPHWHIDKGQKVFLYGPSGSGKSTLLNLLAGTLKPNTGTIHILGQEVSALSSRKRDKFRAQHIGVVFQQFNLIPYLSVEQNIRAAAWLGNNIDNNLDNKIQSIVTQLQLPLSVLSQQASQLSVGQQQRVAIARALINQPELMIVDEPTSALDTTARDSFMQLLLASCEQAKSTLIFVSHDPGLKNYFDTSVSLTEINKATLPGAKA